MSLCKFKSMAHTKQPLNPSVQSNRGNKVRRIANPRRIMTTRPSRLLTKIRSPCTGSKMRRLDNVIFGQVRGRVTSREMEMLWSSGGCALRELRLVIFFLFTSQARAQSANPAPTDGGAKPFPSDSWLTSRETVAAACVLMFGLVMTIIASRMLSRSRVPADDVIRLFALVIIVTGVLFLVAAGYSATDIAPSMGLLGTIAGYILGRTSKGNPQERRPNGGGDSSQPGADVVTSRASTAQSSGSNDPEQ
jgi:hypothetical protein